MYLCCFLSRQLLAVPGRWVIFKVCISTGRRHSAAPANKRLTPMFQRIDSCYSFFPSITTSIIKSGNLNPAMCCGVSGRDKAHQIVQKHQVIAMSLIIIINQKNLMEYCIPAQSAHNVHRPGVWRQTRPSSTITTLMGWNGVFYKLKYFMMAE